MITGRVARDGREAVIMLSVRGPTGRTLQLDAIIDTGFTDSLTLREHQIDDLKLPWRGRVKATLADGRSTMADVYRAHVMWDGESKPIIVAAVEAKPLVGMDLMRDHRLTVKIIPGGLLLLENISSE